MLTEHIALIEECAANALPPSYLQVIDGWRLRYNQGVTRRANSVLAAYEGSYKLEDKLKLVGAFYGRLGARARFQLCPASQPKHLDDFLAARGYRIDGVVQVQTAAISTVLAKTRSLPGFQFDLCEQANKDWLALYTQLEHPGDKSGDKKSAAIRRAMFRRIPVPTAYVLLCLDDRAAAVGLGVLERGQLGIFNMVTAPNFRRRGVATAIIQALAAWGEERGAKEMYLQVAQENFRAQAMYERLGFATLYNYHYRLTEG